MQMGIYEHLRDEIKSIKRAYPHLKPDEAFVLWFLRAYVADSEESALKAVVGKSGDKNIDAIYIDTRARRITVVQGKLREGLGEHAEKRNDVLALADIGLLPWKESGFLDAFYRKLDPAVRDRLNEMIAAAKEGYAIDLYFVTTGRCGAVIRKEADERIREAEGEVSFKLIDGNATRNIFKDYLEGVAPGVTNLSLRISGGANEGVIHRFDPISKIDSWIFSMSSSDIGEMFDLAGVRLFARNIRGYLGEESEINEAMAETIKDHPSDFWYYNNGVTLVCDDATRIQEQGHDVLRVERPQVINGQQTTRTLSRVHNDKAKVLVKVIRIPREDGDEIRYDDLVSSIVRATNWQNAIKPSDLISNDFVQVSLERELRKRNYQYLRKRLTKSEARSIYGNIGFQIHKEEFAQAIAATEHDPSLLKKGKEVLFTGDYYRQLFHSQTATYYLPRYWLSKQVKYVARKTPKRKHAIWHVVHALWEDLASEVSRNEGERRFRYACEQDIASVLAPLYQCTEILFSGILEYYRANKGKGEEEVNIAAFFKKDQLPMGFDEYWRSKKCATKRKKYDEKLEVFKRRLQVVELD